MKTTLVSVIEAGIRSTKAELQHLGLMHPGSLSKQYQVCGRAGCRCADPQHPQRHGPYWKLAYVYRGQPVCRFVRAGSEKSLRLRLAVYKRFRQLIDQWIELSIRQGVIDYFSPPATRPKKNKRAAPRLLVPRS
jgi:hypothetical protein